MTASTRKKTDRFRLRIDLTGICLYLWDADRKSVTLVMPDAALRPKKPPPRHPDGTRAVPHAGYLRFNLKNLATNVAFAEPEPTDDIPSYEVVHRFQFEELKLNLPSGDVIDGHLDLPNADVFAPTRMPRRDLDHARPPACVLMRARLAGGRFRTTTESIDWKIDGDLRMDRKMTDLSIGGTVRWERMLDGTGLDVVLSRFDGTGTVTIPLRAQRSSARATPEIRLKIANLCANPLDWSELETPKQPVADVDFKWLYKLLEPAPGTTLVDYPEHLCPVPEPVLRLRMNQGDLDDCYGLQATRR